MTEASTQRHTTTHKGLSLVVAAILLLPSLATAAEADFINDTTGANSQNDNTVDLNRTVQINFTNTGNATNTFDITANTGNNTVSQNTTVGDVTTGDITLDLTADTELNDAQLVLPDSLIESLGEGLSVSSSNENTGSGSNNINTQTVNQDFTLNQTNTATINNNATLDLNTGNNTVSQNTTVGDIHFGGIDATITFTSQANTPSGNGGGTTPGGTTGGTVTQPVVTGSGAATPTPTVIAQGGPKTTATLGGQGSGFFPAGGSSMNWNQALLLLIVSFVLVFRTDIRKLIDGTSDTQLLSASPIHI